MRTLRAVFSSVVHLVLLGSALCTCTPLFAAPPKAQAKAQAKAGDAKPAQSPSPIRTSTLKPGQYRWMPELAPTGPVVVLVSLPEQMIYVYRNGIRIGASTISSGKKGYETPPGVFPIIERQSVHFSNRYDNAPMPFMLRLTMDGIALHAGKLPGYPASHGCIRLPPRFAEALFHTVRRDVLVVVADSTSHPPEVITPGWVTPVDPATGTVRAVANDAITEIWAPERAPEGPLSILFSSRDRRLIVLRNGIEIGRADATITGEPAAGTHVHALLSDPRDVEHDESTALSIAINTMMGEPSPPPPLRWQALAMAGQKKQADAASLLLRGGELVLTERFARQLADVLPVDATVVITDGPLGPETLTAPLPPAPTTPVEAPRADETPITRDPPTATQIPPLKG